MPRTRASHAGRYSASNGSPKALIHTSDVAVMERKNPEGKVEMVEVKGIENRDSVWKETWKSLG